MRREIRAVERRIDLDASPGVGDLERQPRAALDRAVQRVHLRATAREHDARDVRIRRGREKEVERALELAGHDLGNTIHHAQYFLRYHAVLDLAAADLVRLRL